VDRRNFFIGSVVGLGALAVPGCAKSKAVDAPSTVPPLGANPSWANVRAQFRLTRERIHMTASC
jgi:hypothetical protein